MFMFKNKNKMKFLPRAKSSVQKFYEKTEDQVEWFRLFNSTDFQIGTLLSVVVIF